MKKSGESRRRALKKRKLEDVRRRASIMRAGLIRDLTAIIREDPTDRSEVEMALSHLRRIMVPDGA